MHCPDQPASKCRDCQHSPELAEWRAYWAWRRTQVEWTVTPVLSATQHPYSTITGRDPITMTLSRVNVAWRVLYMADVVTRAVQAIENNLFSKPIFNVTKADAIRRALATEVFVANVRRDHRG